MNPWKNWCEQVLEPLPHFGSPLAVGQILGCLKVHYCCWRKNTGLLFLLISSRWFWLGLCDTMGYHEIPSSRGRWATGLENFKHFFHLCLEISGKNVGIIFERPWKHMKTIYRNYPVTIAIHHYPVYLSITIQRHAQKTHAWFRRVVECEKIINQNSLTIASTVVKLQIEISRHDLQHGFDIPAAFRMVLALLISNSVVMAIACSRSVELGKQKSGTVYCWKVLDLRNQQEMRIQRYTQQ